MRDDEFDDELELDEEVELGVGGVCSFSPNPSPDPVSNRTSRVKLRGAGKLLPSMLMYYGQYHRL